MKIKIFCILYRTFTLLRALVLELEDWVFEKLFEDEGWDDDKDDDED